MPKAVNSARPRNGSMPTHRNYPNVSSSTQYQANNFAINSQYSVQDSAVQSWIAKDQMRFAPTGEAFGASSTQATGTQTNYRIPLDRERVLGMKKWTGSILEIDKDSITVELVPLDHDGPSLVADFDINLLSPDQSLARKGGIVYLTTRLIEDDWGQSKATTHLRLRRPGHWSKQDLADILKQATKRAETIRGYARRRA